VDIHGYVNKIRALYASGQTTAHSFRPALFDLFQPSPKRSSKVQFRSLVGHHKMPKFQNNRRHPVGGATYFFTVNLLNRNRSLLIEQIAVLRQVVRRVRLLMPFYFDTTLVLPSHMPCLWTLPEGDCNFPKQWQAVAKDHSANEWLRQRALNPRTGARAASRRSITSALNRIHPAFRGYQAPRRALLT
jgi:hypothetical protein